MRYGNWELGLYMATATALGSFWMMALYIGPAWLVIGTRLLLASLTAGVTR